MLEKDLHLPYEYYFLADAGFPICDMLTSLYRAVRYHLKEWTRRTKGNVFPNVSFSYLKLLHRSQNHEELFNFRHASALNAVERIFGIFKTEPEYPIDMQAMFVPALFTTLSAYTRTIHLKQTLQLDSACFSRHL
jgi:hypothetical protein